MSDQEEVAVVWHQYGTKHAAGLDFKRVNDKRWLSSCSAFRITSRDQRQWYIVIVGLEAKIPKAVGRLKHYQMRLKEAPEPDMDEALRLRWSQHVIGAALTGEPVGHRHYIAGAELDRSGRLTPRRFQG